MTQALISSGDGVNFTSAWPMPARRPLASAARSWLPRVPAEPRVRITVPVRVFRSPSSTTCAIEPWRRSAVSTSDTGTSTSMVLQIDPGGDRGAGLHRRTGRREQAPNHGARRHEDVELARLVVGGLGAGDKQLCGFLLGAELGQGVFRLQQAKAGIGQILKGGVAVGSVFEQEHPLFGGAQAPVGTIERGLRIGDQGAAYR